jgi:tRNA pseudouridine55 synthase
LINGIISVYKEKGFTSHDVVAKLRGITKQKKIGHTGTLDPDAEGVLPVCFGNATRLCDMLTNKDKTYEAVLKLGIETDTQDITGKVLNTREVTADKEQIEKAVLSFIGEYDQLPPMYSAIKVNGRRLYELARAGQEVARETRKVKIHNIRILEINEDQHEIRMSVDCSKGTYIRTLCHDIGNSLGCFGCMKSLIRTRSGIFTIENSYKLSEIESFIIKGTLPDYIIRVEEMFPDYAKIKVLQEYSKYIYNGNRFTVKHIADEDKYLKTFVDKINDKENHMNQLVRVYDWQEQFIGIYKYSCQDKSFIPVKMFL